MTRLLIHCWVLALCAMVGATAGISWPPQRDMQQIWSHVVVKSAKICWLCHIWHSPLAYCGRDMPTVTPTIVRMATVSKLEAESWQICRIRRTSFYINGCVTLWLYGLSLKDGRFLKRKKGSATISLGLNYCSMGSYQSPSHDTVPLT
jgi:hypothetical protein